MLGDGAGWVKVEGEAAVLLDAADIKPENTISVQVSLMLGFRYIQFFFSSGVHHNVLCIDQL
jgi:hypothetical protein